MKRHTIEKLYTAATNAFATIGVTSGISGMAWLVIATDHCMSNGLFSNPTEQWHAVCTIAPLDSLNMCFLMFAGVVGCFTAFGMRVVDRY